MNHISQKQCNSVGFSIYIYIYLFMTSFLFVVHTPPTSYESVQATVTISSYIVAAVCFFFSLFSVVYSNWFILFSCFLLLKHDRSLQKTSDFRLGVFFSSLFHLILSSSFHVALTFVTLVDARKKLLKKKNNILFSWCIISFSRITFYSAFNLFCFCRVRFQFLFQNKYKR